MTKDQWKIFYRRLRITRREINKAIKDSILYGNGFIKFNDKKEFERVPHGTLCQGSYDQ